MNTTRDFNIRITGSPTVFYKHTVTPAQLQFVVLMYLINNPIDRITVFQHIGANERHPFAVAWIYPEEYTRDELDRILSPEYYIRENIIFSVRRIKENQYSHAYHLKIIKSRLQYMNTFILAIQDDTIPEDINLIAFHTPEIIYEYVFI